MTKNGNTSLAENQYHRRMHSLYRAVRDYVQLEKRDYPLPDFARAVRHEFADQVARFKLKVPK